MINFNSDNSGTWFYFDEADHDAGGVCLRECSSEKYEEIERLTVKHKKKVKRGIAYDDPDVNESLANKLRWDYCIVDWKGIQLDGQTMACTKENKWKLVKVTDFLKFVATCLEKLVDTNAALEEARLKNLNGSSSGPDEQPAVKTA